MQAEQAVRAGAAGRCNARVHMGADSKQGSHAHFAGTVYGGRMRLLMLPGRCTQTSLRGCSRGARTPGMRRGMRAPRQAPAHPLCLGAPLGSEADRGNGPPARGGRACMISAHSGPTMCTPTTLSLSAVTSSFIIALAGLPEMVFFIGLECGIRVRTPHSPRVITLRRPQCCCNWG